MRSAAPPAPSSELEKQVAAAAALTGDAVVDTIVGEFAADHDVAIPRLRQVPRPPSTGRPRTAARSETIQVAWCGLPGRG
jgi:hypothetical protein